MNPPSDQLETIVDAALDLAPAERAAYLDQACGDDARLRQNVEALLHAHQHAPALSSLAPRSPKPSSALSIPVTEKPGDKIGPYKLLQQIGVGAFGVVYMAEQEQPIRRRVALKVIKLGMDTKQVIARFEAERQALALMDHPNIAKVFDAGATDTGRPYFVMELVRGVKITDYCDQNNLPTHQRLELFMQVCRAIQHAHQKGIIHRDIKPSNILVTLHDGVPVPKVIDFGIAKAIEQKLTDKTLFTELNQFIGTPAYMSPEQAELSGLDIDTRSDIYSLGVLLYELLTGQMPFDPKALRIAGLDEMRRIIREHDPVKPSTKLSSLTVADQSTVARQRQVEALKLVNLVRGDLDWIVMKCLEKDRTRRYAATYGLARDIERHLANEPVMACPPSRFYQFSKLVRRNKLMVASAGAVAAALILGLGLSTVLFIRETRAHDLATSEAKKSEAVARFLGDLLEGMGPGMAKGRDTKWILDKTAERVGQELTNQPAIEAEVLATLGGVYSALAEFETAEKMQRQSLAIRTNLWGARDLKVAESWDQLSRALWGKGELADAVAAARNGLTIRTQLLAHSSPEVATSLNNLGVVLSEQGKLAEAQPLLVEALTLQRNLFKGDDARLAETLMALSTLHWRKRELPEAEKLDREALAMYQRLRGADDPEVAKVLNNLGTVLRDAGNLPEAEKVLREALTIDRKVLGNAHPETATSIYNLAGTLWQGRKLPEAEKLYREWLALPNRDPQQLSKALSGLGTVLNDAGRFAEAVATHRQALAALKEFASPESQDATVFLHNLATALWAHGELAEAEAAYHTLITNWATLFGPENRQVAAELNNLGTVLRDAKRLPEAEQAHRQGLEMQRKLQDRAGEANSLNNLAIVLVSQGRIPEAEPVLRESIRLITELGGRESPLLVKSFRTLAGLLQTAGKTKEAEDTARDCLALSEKHFRDEWLKFDAQSVLGGILAARRADAEAEPLLLSGFQGMQQRADRIPAQNQPRLRQAGERLIKFYETCGKPAQAADWKQKVAELDRPQAGKPPETH